MDIYLTSLAPTAFAGIFASLASFQRLCKLIRADKHAKEGKREARSLAADFRTRINEENEAKRVFSRLQKKKKYLQTSHGGATFKVTFIYSQLSSQPTRRTAEKRISSLLAREKGIRW